MGYFVSGTYPDYLELRGGETPPADPHEGSVRVYADADQALRTIKSDGTDAPVGGGGGGSQPVNWCMLGLFASPPDPLTASANFYELVAADYAIQEQSGSDFSIGTVGENDGVISAGGGRFQWSVLVNVPLDVTIDDSSEAPRYLGFGGQTGEGPPAAMGADDYIPIAEAVSTGDQVHWHGFMLTNRSWADVDLAGLRLS